MPREVKITLEGVDARQNVSFVFIFHGPIVDYGRLKKLLEKEAQTSTLKFYTWMPYPIFAVGQRDYLRLQELLRGEVGGEKSVRENKS